MPPARPSCLIFDLDGTISDPVEGIGRSINHALESFGYPAIPGNEMSRYVGPPLEDTFLERAPGISHDVVVAMIAKYRERYGNVGYAENVLYPFSGFTTGKWEGDVLTAYTTHIKSAYLRRNGAASSDQATITTHFRRHGNVLTVTMFMVDPVYLTEPYIITRSYNLSTNPVSIGGPPCIVGDEGVESGRVPHHLPGKLKDAQVDIVDNHGTHVESFQGVDKIEWHDGNS